MLPSSLGRSHLGPNSRIFVFVLALILGTFLLSWSSLAQGQANGDSRFGLLLKESGVDFLGPAPTVLTKFEVSISGLIIRTKVRQTFVNPGSNWLEGIYTFPLPETAAVDKIRIRIGQRVIEGRIAERDFARRAYQQARTQGKRAALVTQVRPNVFRTAIANVAPQSMIDIELEYQHTVDVRDGLFSVRIPLAITPRYGYQLSSWDEVEALAQEIADLGPAVIEGAGKGAKPVEFNIRMAAGFPIGEIVAPYHAIEQQIQGREAHITLVGDATPGDRDFELNWRAADQEEPQSAAFLENFDGGTYIMVMVAPPTGEADRRRTAPPRDITFVIDRSGSMDGPSMRQAKRATLFALDRLTPRDRFNIIAFNTGMIPLFTGVTTATAPVLQRARDFVNELEAGGGTEAWNAISAAYGHRPAEGRLHQIVFLTDGAVANEELVLNLVRKNAGTKRLFPVGIGSAPNGILMRRAAELGRGTFTYISDFSEVEGRMTRLFAKLERPALTNVEIIWPEGSIVESYPEEAPDLLYGEPMKILARAEGGEGDLVVRGIFNGEAWSRRVPLANPVVAPGVAKAWARSKITVEEARRFDGVLREVVADSVRGIALKFGLVTRYTSLIAVDATPVRDRRDPLNSQKIAANTPRGWQEGEHADASPQGPTKASLAPQPQPIVFNVPQTATPAALKFLVGVALLVLSAVGARWTRRRRLWPAAS